MCSHARTLSTRALGAWHVLCADGERTSESEPLARPVAQRQSGAACAVGARRSDTRVPDRHTCARAVASSRAAGAIATNAKQILTWRTPRVVAEAPRAHLRTRAERCTLGCRGGCASRARHRPARTCHEGLNLAVRARRRACAVRPGRRLDAVRPLAVRGSACISVDDG